MRHIKKFISTALYIVIFLLFVTFAVALYSRMIIEKNTVYEISPPETEFAQISDSEEIAYQEISNRAPVTIVFVGGLSGWSGTWRRSMTELDSALRSGGLAYNLVAIDLPPFGFSTSDLSGDFYRSTQASRIYRFLEKKEIKNLIFVAHSYGAGPVTEVVMSYGDSLRIQKLVVIDGVLNIDEQKPDTRPDPTPDGATKDALLNKLLTEKHILNYFVLMVSHSKALVQNRLSSFVHVTENIDQDLIELYMASFSSKNNSKRLAYWLSDYMTDPLNYKSTESESYRKLKLPVRIIWGDKDILTPPTLAYQLRDLVPGSKLYMLENVGHIPMIEDYQQFDEALKSAVTE